jgi:hypothetical protein
LELTNMSRKAWVGEAGRLHHVNIFG